MAQAGARQPGYEPGPYSPYTEELVDKFCDWYVGRMSEHLLPQPARKPRGDDARAKKNGAAKVAAALDAGLPSAPSPRKRGSRDQVKTAG
jgi:hypothetical protein